MQHKMQAAIRTVTINDVEYVVEIEKDVVGSNSKVSKHLYLMRDGIHYHTIRSGERHYSQLQELPIQI